MNNTHQVALAALVLAGLTGIINPVKAAPTANLFELTELQHISSGNSTLLAASCGAGSCGGKAKSKKSDKSTHSCSAKAKDGAQQSGSKSDQTSGSTKGADQREPNPTPKN